jgi:hypothetical protein
VNLRFILLASCLVVPACGSTILTLSGPQYRPREPSCEIRVFTTPPVSGFIEIATIDVRSGAYRSNSYTRIDDFKDEIRPYVCRAGGDAAIGYANGEGRYITASVLKRVTVPNMAPSSQPVFSAAPVNNFGCHFDTQCKGDRVCVRGVCVDPVPRTSAATTTVPPSQ